MTKIPFDFSESKEYQMRCDENIIKVLKRPAVIYGDEALCFLKRLLLGLKFIRPGIINFDYKQIKFGLTAIFKCRSEKW